MSYVKNNVFTIICIIYIIFKLSIVTHSPRFVKLNYYIVAIPYQYITYINLLVSFKKYLLSLLR